MSIERRRILVAVRVSDREHQRWQTAAEREALRLPELVREAVRAHLRDLVRLDLLGRSHAGAATARPREVEIEAPESA
jgi:hypothetical protein